MKSNKRIIAQTNIDEDVMLRLQDKSKKDERTVAATLRILIYKYLGIVK